MISCPQQQAGRVGRGRCKSSGEDRVSEWSKYGPTAARSHGRPGRELRPKSITIDSHSHVAVPAAAAFVAPHLEKTPNALAHFATPDSKALNQRQDAERRPHMTRHDLRLADLDAMGIDRQLVMPPPPQCYYTVPLDVAAKAAQIVNDGSLPSDRGMQNSRFIGRIHALRFSAMPAERKSPIERAADNPRPSVKSTVSGFLHAQL